MRAGSADINREQSDDARHHHRRAPAPSARDKTGDRAGKQSRKHQVARLMLIIRPRRCAGHVSATSIDPSDHSPLSAKVRSARAATKTANLGDSATIGIISENIAILTHCCPVN